MSKKTGRSTGQPLRRWLALVLCIGLLVGACGGDDGETDAGSGGTGDEGGSTEPQVGGSATILLHADQATMDPVRFTGSGSTDAQRGFAVYGALVALDSETGETTPILAESLSGDSTFKTWTLVLRENLVFTDGSPFNAEAVRVNWERVKNPASASPAQGFARSIESMQTVDARTLRITLTTPNAHFDNGVSRQALNYIASAQAIQAGHDLANDPIGAGPFTLESWVRDDRMELVRNDQWYDAPKPYLDRLTLRVVTDEEQRSDTYLTGDAEVIYITGASTTKRVIDANDGPSLVTRLALGQGLSFNTARAPLNDPRVRRAIAVGVDREALADAAEGEGVDVATHFSVLGSWWSNPDAEVPAYDPAEAQRLLSEYARETGKPVTFAISATQSNRNQAIAKFVQTSLSQMKDVQVEIRSGDSASFVQWALQGDYDVQIWGYPTIDPDPGLFNAFHSGLVTNIAKYANPKVDAALDAGRMTDDADERAEEYGVVQAQLAEDLPFLPLTNTANAFVAAEGIDGLAVYEDGILRTDLVWSAASS